MTYPQSEPTLDCQDCGEVVMRLSVAEAQRVAEKPYDYVVWCFACSRHQS